MLQAVDDTLGDLATHRGFSRVFQPRRLTFGFIAPLEGYPDRPAPTMRDHALAAATHQIAIGTAGIILPLRDPLAVAKQATSLDHLTGNRFLLGLSTGDRPVEYLAFGVSVDNRAERFRDAHVMLRARSNFADA